MSNQVKELKDADFQSAVTSSAVPVLVDFWAEWCMPCRMMAPVLDAVAEDLAGKLTVAKVNVDENPEVARQFMIQAIPTMVLFDGGKEKTRFVGGMTRERLVAAIGQNVTIQAS